MCNPNSGWIKRKFRVLWNIIILKLIIPIRKKVSYDTEWNYKGTMNPVEYWYEKNHTMREFVSTYYQENIKKVKDSEIQGYLKTLYEKGGVLDKMVMLTALSIYKQYGN